MPFSKNYSGYIFLQIPMFLLQLEKGISTEVQKEHDYIPWKSIRGMRNKIVHDY